MPRQARLDSPGTLHHVMIRGIEKKRIVGVDRLANGLRSNRSGDAGLKTQLMSGFWAAEHL
jgi:hypothetical protein